MSNSKKRVVGVEMDVELYTNCNYFKFDVDSVFLANTSIHESLLTNFVSN